MKTGELTPYLSMIHQTKELVLNAILEGKSPVETKNSGVLKGWEKWNSSVFPGYMTTNDWIDNLYSALEEGKERSASYLLSNELEQSGLKAMLAKYKSLTVPGKIKCFFIETEMNNWGYALLAQQNLSAALEVMKINAEQFPGSANAYDSLGEAFMIPGNKDLAIRNYEKSLELNPQNANATQQLKELRIE